MEANSEINVIIQFLPIVIQIFFKEITELILVSKVSLKLMKYRRVYVNRVHLMMKSHYTNSHVNCKNKLISSYTMKRRIDSD
jgi:hypothetical protein